ncbi:MAG: hypothetical protein RR846_01900 [Oscillospiraceae bacterium]
MSNIFIGQLFILVNFNFTINGHIFDCAPNFVGWYFIYKGIGEIYSFSTENFSKAKNQSLVLCAIELTRFLGLLFAGYGARGLVNNIFACLIAALELGVLYYIIQGLFIVQAVKNKYLYADRLMKIWKSRGVICVVYLAVSILSLNTAAVICAIISLVVSVNFLMVFYKAKEEYNAV